MMKISGVLLLVTMMSLAQQNAHGADDSSAPYTCEAPANADRGFDEEFTVTLTSQSKSGAMVLRIGSREMQLGKIDEEVRLDRQNLAFNETIGLIGEPDVSGISVKEISHATEIRVFAVKLSDGDEAVVFQIFNGSDQIGGTFMFAAQATACLPKGFQHFTTP